jgi:GNAT superfamily N-acetyltransferase
VTAGPAALEVVLRLSVGLAPEALAELFAVAWPDSTGPRGDELEHSLCWVSAHVGERLIGFVNVAWDGGVHAFLLDTTVHPEFRRRGIGISLVRCAADEARELGAEWLHVDYEPRYAEFYRRCGFQPTAAGVLSLRDAPADRGARPTPALRKYAGTDAAACRSLMTGLGNWFGIATAIDAYLADLERLPTWVAVLDGNVVGFVSVTRSAPRTFEVHVLAVAAERHGQGIGRALMRQAERWALALGARFMQVKTLGPSHADPYYARTRGFYLQLGYEPLLETDRFWGEGNPTLLLVKAIG